ncbi:hypothetical protein Tco_0241700 [Tanacetum coccineum]
MEELLRAPTEGYGEAIVIPEINADHFEIKTNLLQLVQASRLYMRLKEPCVTCGGAHAYYNCPNTDNNQSSVCAATGAYNQVVPPNRVSNHMAPPGFAPVQNNGQNRSRPSLVSFETSDSLLEEFTDELALLDLFPPGNEDVDFKADLREIKLLLNRDPSTNFSPTITIDPNPERFTDEPSLSCLPPPGDDESFLKKDVQEENFQIYSNPLFEFDDNHNPSNINPLFKEMLEDVKIKDSNVSNYDEPVLLNTPLFDEDECFNPGGKIDKIDAFMEDYRDSEGNVLEILHNTIHNLFPEVFFDHEPQGLKAYGEFFSIICEIIL